MSSNDRQMNGQPRPNCFLDHLELPPAPKDQQRLARLRAAWKASWEEGGFLYQSGVPTGSLSGPWLMLLHLSS
ncbi:hypothetical protein ACFY8K_34105 [Streptomyces misionensis]|uniref:hypothetical protein n=1 Tax=Streptomyces misionensis TaxID=67331 RepID=UPI0036AE7032